MLEAAYSAVLLRTELLHLLERCEGLLHSHLLWCIEIIQKAAHLFVALEFEALLVVLLRLLQAPGILNNRVPTY